MSSRTQIKDNDFSVIFIKFFKAAAAGVVPSALLLLLFSFILTKNDIPLMLLNPLGSILLSLSSFISGYFAARQFRKRGMAVGAGCGLVIFMLIFLLSLMYGFSIGIAAVIKLTIALLSGASGGVIGVNAKTIRK